jgi:muramidase (phage lysozyme)
MLERVSELIKFAEEQTTYDYSVNSDEKEPFHGTAVLVEKMKKGEFKHKKGEKKPHKSLHICFTYVKVALFRARWVDCALKEKYASNADKDLEPQGFKNVTKEVLDPRWAAAGDIIVYSYAPVKLAQKGGRNLGHIDIRSEKTYISDFMPEVYYPCWKVLNKGEPPYAVYENVRIYRKYFDPTPSCRMHAFLRCIADYETPDAPDEDHRFRALYKALPGGLSVNEKGHHYFKGFDAHPWAHVPDGQRGTETAAGAYGITYTNWKNLFEQCYFPDEKKPSFTPNIQKRIAGILMEQARSKSGDYALPKLRSGDIEGAVKIFAKTWASLPGGKQTHKINGVPATMKDFMSLYEKYFDEEKKKAGLT